jgi:hypothetical protein
MMDAAAIANRFQRRVERGFMTGFKDIRAASALQYATAQNGASIRAILEEKRRMRM